MDQQSPPASWEGREGQASSFVSGVASGFFVAETGQRSQSSAWEGLPLVTFRVLGGLGLHSEPTR